MNLFKKPGQFASFLAALALVALAAPMATSQAQTTTTYYTTDLSNSPPDLTVAVSPNIAVTFDDSGSMGSTGLPDTLDGTQGNAYYYASITNSQYYNPAITYTPPLRADGQSRFTAASYTSAPLDGICYYKNAPAKPPAGCGSTNDLSSSFTSNFGSNTSTGRQANQGGNINIPNNVAGGQSGGFYYTCPTVGSNSGCKINLITADQQQNFANWYSYYRTRNLMTRSAIANVFAGLGSTIRVVFQNLNNSSYVLTTGTTTFDAFTDTARTKFFTWLYNVNASGGTPTRPAIDKVGKIFMYGKGHPDNTNPYWEPNIGDDSAGLELSCRLNYSLLVTDGYWNGADPGNPAGDKNPVTVRTPVSLPDGTQYSGAVSGDPESKIFWNVPKTSYTTLSDLAFYYWATNLRPDFVTAGGKPKLGVPPSFVDYTDQNNLPVNWDGTGTPPKSLYFNPANDPATWPHVVQFMIALGIDGSLDFPGDYNGLRSGTASWPTPSIANNGDLTDIDDTWHAAVSSRGQYFSARDPAALSTALTQLLTRIISRSSSSVAGALSSAVLTGDSVTYRTGFDSSNWSGSLVANIVDVSGNIGKQLWSAGDLLTTRAAAGDTRVIITSKAPGAGNGVPFTWASISTQLSKVDADFTAANGDAKVKYLRGDRSKEGTDYRRRNSVLGAIINSQPVYVAFPASGYTDSFPPSPSNVLAPEMAVDSDGKRLYSYEQFVSDHNKRAPTLYVGANDGMLHAFDATTDATDPKSVDVTPSPGRERWAYVPFSAYDKLDGLTAKTGFTFQPTVDATPVTRDVFFSGGTKGWRTIIVGGLRLGGRGIYALDITDAATTESNAGTKVLWEFTKDSTGGANLGYTYGKPNIGRLANGKWVVLVPSGYFPTGSTDTAAANTQSSLFVLDVQTGAVLAELKTPTSVDGVSGNIVSYGLSSPVLGDYDNDQVDDVAFAGDLQGNLWRFDLADEKPANWKVSLAYRPSNASASTDPVPGDQPITVMPRLFADPTSSYFMVVFGTGKYLGGTDNTADKNTKTQSVYGIRDPGPGSTTTVIGRGSLIKQTLTESGNLRGLTTLPVPAADSKSNTINGWYFDLFTGTSSAQTNKGERVVVDATALFDSGRAIITSLIPGSTDPCAPVRKGAIMVIDAATGGAASGVNVGSGSLGAGFSQAGARVTNVPVTGALPAATSIGGGNIALPGVSIQASDGSTGNTFNVGDAIWRRRSWRVLNNVN